MAKGMIFGSFLCVWEFFWEFFCFGSFFVLGVFLGVFCVFDFCEALEQ